MRPLYRSQVQYHTLLKSEIMMKFLCIFSVLLGMTAAQRPDIADVCYPAVPSDCPDIIPDQCSMCCCESSDNVEFYDPDRGEPECTAPPAIYGMSFVTTWSDVCQSDYVIDSQWGSFIAITHNTDYKLWDACMNNISEGLSSDSQDENSFELEIDFINGILNDLIVDIVRGPSIIDGTGTSSDVVIVDKFHQWVSAFSRQIPSPDHIVGVADLGLCDGDEWKETVKVCFELFSTAAASERVAPFMMRNSIQENNCSYGYIEFNFIKSEQFLPRTPISDTCYPKIPDECPDSGPIDECPTCCCESSENVEFYNPDAPEPECTASTATYEITITYTWSSICHPDYYPPGAVFTAPSIVAHNPRYRMWDACMDNPTIGVAILAEQGVTSIVAQEYEAAGDNVLGSVVADVILGGVGTTSRNLTFDKDHQLASAGTMLVPSPDRFLGVADLILCDGDEWKDKVKVCLELFSTATSSSRVAPDMEPNSLQANNCSFGYVEFILLQVMEESSAIPTAVNVGIVGTVAVAIMMKM